MGSDGEFQELNPFKNSVVVLVQEPATAKFDSMPMHATQRAILVDIVAPVELPAS
jgi:two-component system CheB/CheR fusion protein